MAKPRAALSETESLATLVHGIFAITMTLLILELRVPEGENGELLHRLGGLGPHFVAYAYGFVYLAANWLTMREWFHLFRGITRAQTLTVLGFVALISLTPFTVALVADAVHDTDDLGTAVRVMAAVVGTAYGLSAVLTLNVKRRGNIGANQLLGELSSALLVLIAIGPSLLAIALSFVSPWLAIAVLSAELLIAMLQGWELEEESA
jgi:uncharacterized membrane protein